MNIEERKLLSVFLFFGVGLAGNESDLGVWSSGFVDGVRTTLKVLGMVIDKTNLSEVVKDVPADKAFQLLLEMFEDSKRENELIIIRHPAIKDIQEINERTARSGIDDKTLKKLTQLNKKLLLLEDDK